MSSCPTILATYILQSGFKVSQKVKYKQMVYIRDW